MRKSIQLLSLMVLAGSLAGCISMGRPFDTEKVLQIHMGKTTQAEIKDLFGEPYRTGLDSGDLTWTYLNYHFGVLGQQDTTDLYVRFNSDGTVKSYSFNTNVPQNQPPAKPKERKAIE